MIGEIHSNEVNTSALNNLDDAFDDIVALQDGDLDRSSRGSFNVGEIDPEGVNNTPPDPDESDNGQSGDSEPADGGSVDGEPADGDTSSEDGYSEGEIALIRTLRQAQLDPFSAHQLMTEGAIRRRQQLSGQRPTTDQTTAAATKRASKADIPVIDLEGNDDDVISVKDAKKMLAAMQDGMKGLVESVRAEVRQENENTKANNRAREYAQAIALVESRYPDLKVDPVAMEYIRNTLLVREQQTGLPMNVVADGLAKNFKASVAKRAASNTTTAKTNAAKRVGAGGQAAVEKTGGSTAGPNITPSDKKNMNYFTRGGAARDLMTLMGWGKKQNQLKNGARA